MTRYRTDRATCHVWIFREGMLSAVGHDLQLQLTDFDLEAEDEQSVRGTFRMGSLKVVDAAKGRRVERGTLSPRDRSEIEKNMGKVLEPSRFPEAKLQSTSVERSGDALQVSAELTIKGRTRPVRFAVQRDGGSARAEVTIHQPDFGIKPYRAVLGGLRVAADVVVDVDVPVEE